MDGSRIRKKKVADSKISGHVWTGPEKVYKSLNGFTLNYLSSKFIQRSDVITSYILPYSENKLAIPLPRTNHYKNSFGYSGAVLWNTLPSAARQATSLTNFRRLLINSDKAFM